MRCASAAIDLAVRTRDRKPRMGNLIASLLRAPGVLADRAVWRILVKSLAVSLLAFALLAAGGWWLADRLLADAGLANALFAGVDGLRGAAAALLAGIGLWLGWRIVAMAVIQFYADEVFAAVEARHYPAALARARSPGMALQAQAATRSALRALAANLIALPLALALLATGVGAALVFLAVNAWLIGHELADMARLRHANPPGKPAIARLPRYVTGGLVAGLLLVPFVNFLAPVLGAAAAAHLTHRKDRA